MIKQVELNKRKIMNTRMVGKSVFSLKDLSKQLNKYEMNNEEKKIDSKCKTLTTSERSYNLA